MEVGVGDVVLPGDICPEVDVAAKRLKVVLGPGLRRDAVAERVLATRAGVLRKRAPNTYWVESRVRRYVPARGESVVGTVVQKSGDVFWVDIGGSCKASLSYLAFESATKKNRPDVQVGDIVYAKVLVASKDMEPELVCVDSHGKKGRLGVLSDGYVFSCSLNLVHKILSPSCPLIDCLKKEWPFEIAAGMNGRIWIKASTTRETVALGNAILASENASVEDIKSICNNISTILASGAPPIQYQ